MYTGSSINPSMNNIGKNSQFQNRPSGFAIIQLRHPDPTKVIAPEQPLHLGQAYINPYQGNGQPQYNADIAQIIRVLEPRVVHESVSQPEPKVIPQEKTDKPISTVGTRVQSLTDSVDETTALAVTAGLGGLVTGMLLHSKLGTKNVPTKNIASKSDITDTVIKMMPELIKAVATGTTMIATAVGISNWLNQETPERLRARLEATKGN